MANDNEVGNVLFAAHCLIAATSAQVLLATKNDVAELAVGQIEKGQSRLKRPDKTWSSVAASGTNPTAARRSSAL